MCWKYFKYFFKYLNLWIQFWISIPFDFEKPKSSKKNTLLFKKNTLSHNEKYFQVIVYFKESHEKIKYLY